MWTYNYSDELYHHGIKGQKWGVRRYQNKDGSLTAAGKKRSEKLEKQQRKEAKKLEKAQRRWDDNVDSNWQRAYNMAAYNMNNKLSRFNSEWDKKDVDWNNPKSDSYRAYTKAYVDLWNDTYARELSMMFGKAPINTGKEWSKRVPMFLTVEDLIGE